MFGNWLHWGRQRMFFLYQLRSNLGSLRMDGGGVHPLAFLLICHDIKASLTGYFASSSGMFPMGGNFFLFLKNCLLLN